MHARNTHTHTHVRTLTHTYVGQRDRHGCEKDSLEIVIEQVHRWVSVWKQPFTKHWEVPVCALPHWLAQAAAAFAVLVVGLCGREHACDECPGQGGSPPRWFTAKVVHRLCCSCCRTLQWRTCAWWMSWPRWFTVCAVLVVGLCGGECARDECPGQGGSPPVQLWHPGWAGDHTVVLHPAWVCGGGGTPASPQTGQRSVYWVGLCCVCVVLCWVCVACVCMHMHMRVSVCVVVVVVYVCVCVCMCVCGGGGGGVCFVLCSVMCVCWVGVLCCVWGFASVCCVCSVWVSACMCSVFVGRGWGVVINIMQLDHLHAPTLWASLSGTLLQTLPDLVTPLKGYSLSPRSWPTTQSVPSERFGYW